MKAIDVVFDDRNHASGNKEPLQNARYGAADSQEMLLREAKLPQSRATVIPSLEKSLTEQKWSLSDIFKSP